jgi:hypothetical protein
MTDCTFELGNNAVAVISLVINAVVIPLLIKVHNNTKPSSNSSDQFVQ